MSYVQVTPVEYPLEFTKNDTWIIEIPVVDANGDEFDFNGWTAEAHVMVSKHATTAVVTFSSYDLTLELESGILRLNLDYSETNVEAKTYVWDCEFTDPDGRRLTLIKPSEFKVNEDVTI